MILFVSADRFGFRPRSLWCWPVSRPVDPRVHPRCVHLLSGVVYIFWIFLVFIVFLCVSFRSFSKLFGSDRATQNELYRPLSSQAEEKASLDVATATLLETVPVMDSNSAVSSRGAPTEAPQRSGPLAPSRNGTAVVPSLTYLRAVSFPKAAALD